MGRRATGGNSGYKFPCSFLSSKRTVDLSGCGVLRAQLETFAATGYYEYTSLVDGMPFTVMAHDDR